MKQIPFAKKYTISTSGIITSETRGILFPTLHKGGYLRVKLHCDDGVRRAFLVHRLVALTFIPNEENKEEVNHLNGIKTDNRVENLEWATRHENMQHAFREGLNTNRGESNGRALLSSEDAVQAYLELIGGARNVDVARKYGISTTTVAGIKSKAIWTEALQGLPDIPRRPRKERLSEKTVRFICEKLQDGVGPTEILKLSTSDAVTIDIISDIKRRRGYRHISCEYVW